MKNTEIVKTNLFFSPQNRFQHPQEPPPTLGMQTAALIVRKTAVAQNHLSAGGVFLK